MHLILQGLETTIFNKNQSEEKFEFDLFLRNKKPNKIWEHVKYLKISENILSEQYFSQKIYTLCGITHTEVLN